MLNIFEDFTFLFPSEKERKLTYDLKEEVSGEFGTALLILAEVSPQDYFFFLISTVDVYWNSSSMVDV